MAVLLALLFGSAALAWKLLTRPDPRPTVVVNDAERNAPPYFSVAAAAVDLEVIAPDGRRATTIATSDSSRRLPAAETNVDCGGYGREKESESACTASIIVHEPAMGAWKVVVTSSDSTRGEAVSVGYGGKGFRRSGGFAVRVLVDAHRSVEFSIAVAPEGVSQTSKVTAPPR
ncbi:MAG: hypothetical protein HY084_01850 [Gemmatimonadetes bacterium]|nr:hypothetical protein [Gemmatimonadota bacterium]